MIVYVVLTDGPSRGGSIYSIKATLGEAVQAASKLNCPADAIILPWEIGSEAWDERYMEVTNGKEMNGEIDPEVADYLAGHP